MFHIRNLKGTIDHFKTESFAEAKAEALILSAEYGQPFQVIEIKQVWTTQTLEEAINSK